MRTTFEASNFQSVNREIASAAQRHFVFDASAQLQAGRFALRRAKTKQQSRRVERFFEMKLINGLIARRRAKSFAQSASAHESTPAHLAAQQ